MSVPLTISLVPLSPEWHIDALQQVYLATPGYWAMYNLLTAPIGQAENDLRTAAATPGRTIVGIVRRVEAQDTANAAAVELIGLIDLRLHWPNEQMVSIGMVMVAEPYQRLGVGTQAWQLLKPWLTAQGQMKQARLTVEQFNPGALQFFQSLGFTLTGEANRIKVGDKFVRLLAMELPLT
ncbi:MAG: GNAT family N-acetyltransferase [Caldilinea sp. CFX5]|nr:GNAT family N-acetyltransferase [Caldilinea sp. CFX5]